MAFGIYIHWPFCESKCPYCDFNSHVADEVDATAWADAYRRGLDHYLPETSGREVTSVFFGGGTPTLMPTATMAAVISHIKDRWPVAESLEITAEANPSSAEVSVFEQFSAAGVNRLSIGVQSFRDQDLIFLGRPHTAEDGRRAIKAVRHLFSRWSFDLIYARSGQTKGDWRAELAEALDFGPSHLSLYQLTIEPGTEFHRKRVVAADGDIGTDLFEITQEMTESAGLPAYEISNHAAAGQECRHNLLYWQGDDYLGIGPGAHGRLTTGVGTGSLTTEMIHEFRDPAGWLARNEETGTGLQKRTNLTPLERCEELILMGLRLREGINAEHFQHLTGRDLFAEFDAQALDRLISGGFLEKSATHLNATPAGRLRLNAVISALLT